jgi:hypothetical protein
MDSYGDSPMRTNLPKETPFKTEVAATLNWFARLVTCEAQGTLRANACVAHLDLVRFDSDL